MNNSEYFKSKNVNLRVILDEYREARDNDKQLSLEKWLFQDRKNTNRFNIGDIITNNKKIYVILDLPSEECIDFKLTTLSECICKKYGSSFYLIYKSLEKMDSFKIIGRLERHLIKDLQEDLKMF